MTRHERTIDRESVKLTHAEIAHEQMILRKRREYVERKIAHWSKFGTPAEINPHTGAAAPKHKRDADKLRAKKLLKECTRYCKAAHYRAAA